jgi:hypothetical protein
MASSALISSSRSKRATLNEVGGEIYLGMDHGQGYVTPPLSTQLIRQTNHTLSMNARLAG